MAEAEVSDEDEASEALNDDTAMKKQSKSVLKAMKACKAIQARDGGAPTPATATASAGGVPKKKLKLAVELSNLVTLVQSVHFKGEWSNDESA